MGRLVDGNWTNVDLGTDRKGRYVRRAALFRDRVSADPDAKFPAEPGRYHLYVSHACGWSHRTVIARALLQLEDVVTISYVEPHMGEQGWTFADPGDPLLGRSKLYEIYLAADPGYSGRASVPVLWDGKEATIVTNESTDIVRSFEDGLAARGSAGPRFFPPELATELDAMIQENYRTVQNGVYACGFAGSQEAHEEAARRLFTRLDELEELLGRRRFLLGDKVSAADWFLFPTLYRFDSVYYIHFKCCLRQLRDYRNLWAYTRDLYQHPGIAATCNMPEIRAHYYTSHESVHPRRYIPIGPVIDFDEPHGRDRRYTQ